MSDLAGLEYVSFVVDASADAPWSPHEAHRRSFGADGSSTHHPPAGAAVVERAELIAEQGDTLTIMVTGDGAPRTIALTILSPTVGELTITSGGAWARGVVALLGLPASHHDH